MLGTVFTLKNAWRNVVVVLATSMVIGGFAVPAGATPTSFTQGDLVIYETQGTSNAAQAVDLVDYSTSGTPSGFSVALPTTASGSNSPLVESGSALNDGLLTDSADGESLVATGYDAATGTASITGSTVPRTVAIVSPAGGVDTTTTLSDGTTEGNNFRSATTASTGATNIYTGGGGGLGYATYDNSNSSTPYLNTSKVHEVLINGGQLYASTTTNIFSIGSGLPTSGTPTATALLSGTNLPSHFGPDQFAFATLGSDAGPDTLYVADGSNGATSGEPNAVEKYSLESGVWTATGSVTVPLAVGVAVSVSGSTVNIYATGATSSSASNNTILYGMTDSSGYGGTLSGSCTGTVSNCTTLATAPTGTDFKGLAWAPVSPGSGTPETSVVIGLPVLGALLIGGYVVVYRRRARTA